MVKIHNMCFFRKAVIDQHSQNMFFPKIGRMTKVHKMCFSENRSDEISEKCARPDGQRKIVGFCIHIILQGSASREIRICPPTKISCFDKMSEFFRRTHFSAKHVLYTSAVFRVYERCVFPFFVGHKKFAQNPEMCARDCRPGKNCRFLCKVHSSGERIL